MIDDYWLQRTSTQLRIPAPRFRTERGYAEGVDFDQYQYDGLSWRLWQQPLLWQRYRCWFVKVDGWNDSQILSRRWVSSSTHAASTRLQLTLQGHEPIAQQDTRGCWAMHHAWLPNSWTMRRLRHSWWLSHAYQRDWAHSPVLCPHGAVLTISSTIIQLSWKLFDKWCLSNHTPRSPWSATLGVSLDETLQLFTRTCGSRCSSSRRSRYLLSSARSSMLVRRSRSSSIAFCSVQLSVGLTMENFEPYRISTEIPSGVLGRVR